MIFFVQFYIVPVILIYVKIIALNCCAFIFPSVFSYFLNFFYGIFQIKKPYQFGTSSVQITPQNLHNFCQSILFFFLFFGSFIVCFKNGRYSRCGLNGRSTANFLTKIFKQKKLPKSFNPKNPHPKISTVEFLPFFQSKKFSILNTHC